jgi:hypothetical protein
MSWSRMVIAVACRERRAGWRLEAGRVTEQNWDGSKVGGDGPGSGMVVGWFMRIIKQHITHGVSRIPQIWEEGCVPHEPMF